VYRQGDVSIVAVTSAPAERVDVARENGRVILADGEVTGHAHVIKATSAALFRDPKLTAVFMTVSGDVPVALEHEEHETIMIPPGDHQIIRRREYSPQEIRNVAD
jgi:hypothetical protein